MTNHKAISEYEVLAITDAVNSSSSAACANCIFSMSEPNAPKRGICLNEYIVETPDGYVERKSHLPDCMDLSSTNPSANSNTITYRMAHKVSGALLSNQDMLDLVDHYKGKPQ